MRAMLFLASVFVTACGGSGTGEVSVLLTDSPTDLAHVSQVRVTFDEVRIHSTATSSYPEKGARGTRAAEEEADGPGWIVLCTDQQTLDLLALRGGRFAPLCARPAASGGVEARPVEVPAGRVSQVRLNVTSAQLVFDDGRPPVDLTIPSGSTSGLKINVQRDVPEGGLLTLRLDLDAAESIHLTTDGQYQMQPVLRLLP